MHDALEQIKFWQRQRKFAIKQRIKLENGLGAFLRLGLGWSPELPEARSAAIKKRASELVALGKAETKWTKKREKALASGKPDISAWEQPDDPEYQDYRDIILPSLSAMRPFDDIENTAIKWMEKLVRQFPVYPWAKDVKGFGDLGLAVILAEVGDLANYPKKGHLWKRLGMAPFEGKAYSTWRREGGLSADDWTEAGYSPRRRAEIYAVVSEPLFRQQTVVQGPYRAIYDRRRERTAIAHPDWTKMHSHMDGLRVMTKYLLRDLWRQWNGWEEFKDAPNPKPKAPPGRKISDIAASIESRYA